MKHFFLFYTPKIFSLNVFIALLHSINITFTFFARYSYCNYANFLHCGIKKGLLSNVKFTTIAMQFALFVPIPTLVFPYVFLTNFSSRH